MERAIERAIETMMKTITHCGERAIDNDENNDTLWRERAIETMMKTCICFLLFISLLLLFLNC